MPFPTWRSCGTLAPISPHSQPTMSNMKIAIGAQATIEDEMAALQAHIADYRSALNQEGIWLFLSTLGCWSVSQPLLQFLGFALALVLFGQRMLQRLNETRSFSKLIKTIETRISELTPEGDSRKARLYDLATFQKQELSTLKSLRSTGYFLLCWAFYGASFVHSMSHLNPHVG